MPTRIVLFACLLLSVPGIAAAQVNTYAFVPHVFDDQAVVVDVAARAALPGSVTTIGDAMSATASPDGRWVYVAGMDASEITVVDVATRTVVGTIPLPAFGFGSAFHPDGRRAYVVCPFDDSVVIVDVATHTVVGSPMALPPGVLPILIKVAPDGWMAYVAAVNGVYPLDLATSTVQPVIPVPGDLGGLAITPDGQTAFVVRVDGGDVVVIDLATRTVTGSIAVGPVPIDIAMSPDGQRAYVTNVAADNVSVIDVATRTVLSSFPVGAGPMSIQVTPDGRDILIINGDDDTLTIADAATSAAIGPPIPVGSGRTHGAQFITPSLIVPAGGPFSAAGDAALASAGFRRFVPFLGGTLRLTANWTTARTLSLLTPGGTLDTNGFDAVIAGPLLNPGTFTKAGQGMATLAGTNVHGGTALTAGTLFVTGAHAPPIAMTGGTLSGEGQLGTVTASGGRIAPAWLYVPDDFPVIGTMRATDVTLGPGATLQINLLGPGGPGVGNGHDQLLTSGSFDPNGAVLQMRGSVSALAVGTTFLIATNATGTFDGLPEGGIMTIEDRDFAISYIGGDGNDVVVRRVNTPPYISAMPSRWGPENTPVAPNTFSVGDFDAGTTLTVTATSSNQDIMPDSSLLLTGSGATRTIAFVTPPFGASGAATITVTVSDGMATATSSFTLSVSGGTYLLAEGATGSFFDTDILIVNPNATAAPISIHFLRPAGAPIVETRTLAPMSRTTIAVDQIAGLEDASFSAVVTSHSWQALVVERTMRWGEGGYGAHTEKATQWPGLSYYFAEGAQGFFSTFFLLVNQQPVANTAHVSFLREGLPVLQRDYPLAPWARFTLDAASVPELRNTSFGAVVTFDRPGAAERAMYFGATPLWNGGHASSGAMGPFTSWFFAEGATGSYFTTFLLLANPGPDPADVTIRYLPSTGAPVTRTLTIPPMQRVTRNIATEHPSLVNAAVATEVASSQSIVAERAQYWGGAAWLDAHASAGEISTERKWGLAEGRVGGPDGAQTYILLANPGTTAATVTATFIRESGGTVVKTFTVPPASRVNIAVTGSGGQVPELADERFGAIIESTQPISVERSVYSNADGVTWAAGTNAGATFLP